MIKKNLILKKNTINITLEKKKKLEEEKMQFVGNNYDSEWDFSEKPYFPPEILEKFAEYTQLDELENSQICNYEKFIANYKEDFVKEKIVQNFKNAYSEKKNCVPDNKSLVAILENGWVNLSEFLIKEIYLPKNIDPSNIVIGYINSSQSKLKSISEKIKDSSKSKKLNVKFSFENFDESIKMNIIFPDASYVPEYTSIFCYKDSFKVNAIVKSRNNSFKLNESKKFFAEIVGNCQYIFNSFSNSIEITFEKAKKLKKWEKLFI